MKKILITLGLATIATGVFAQGQASWANFTGLITNRFTTSAFAPGFVGNSGTSGKIGTAANGYYFTLLYTTGVAPVNNSPTNAGWLQATIGAVPVIGTNYSGLAGDMQGPKGSSTMLLDNWAAGQAGSFIIVGWSANLGTTWATVSSELIANWSNISGYSAANNYFFGVSTIGTGTLTGSPSPAYNLWSGAGAPGNAFTMSLVGPVAPVPEPGTLALAALGGASLLLFRRRK